LLKNLERWKKISIQCIQCLFTWGWSV